MTQPRHSPDTAPTRPRRGPDTAPTQPRGSPDTALTQPRHSPETAPTRARRSPDAAPTQPRRGPDAAPTQPRRSPDTAPTQPRHSHETALAALGSRPLGVRGPLGAGRGYPRLRGSGPVVGGAVAPSFLGGGRSGTRPAAVCWPAPHKRPACLGPPRVQEPHRGHPASYFPGAPRGKV